MLFSRDVAKPRVAFLTMQRLYAFMFLLLLFILPIPETTALRHVLIAALLVGLAWYFRRGLDGCKPVTSGVRTFLVLLGALTIWFLLQAEWVSDETAWALREIRSQWLPAILAALLGVGTVQLGYRFSFLRENLLTALVGIFLAQTIFCLAVCFPSFLETGIFPQGKTLWTAGKLEISFWNNLALAFLVVDGFSRWVYNCPLTKLSTFWVVGGIGLVLGSNLLFGARNGVIGSLMLLSSLGVLVAWRERRRLGLLRTMAVLAGVVTLIGGLVVANLALDSRWDRFAESVKIAWQIDAHQAWLNPDHSEKPRLASGETVEESAYMRVAWIRAGLEMIEHYPMGVGYGRNAFGHALRRTMETRLGHAHSGLIDWTIGVGLPGLVLWLGFIGWVVWLGIRRYFAQRDPLGLVLVFVGSSFLGRMLLDSINRDHMLIVFFLVLAMLVAIPEKSEQA